MKYTSIMALAALFGTAEGVKLESSTFLTMTNGRITEVMQGWEGYHPKMHEFPGTVNMYGNFMDAYERTLPERFTGDSADTTYPVDKFTQNMIENYALEGVDGMKVKNPKPNGLYYMKKATAREVAAEIIGTHFGLKGADAEKFLNEKFDAAFDYYDVNKEGRIDAIGMSAQMFRFLCKPLGELDL
jgi:hypothetical protein